MIGITPAKGIVETDETFISWQKRKKRGDRLPDGFRERNWLRYKMTTMGVVERGGKVVAGLVDGRTEWDMAPFLKQHVSSKAMLVSDALAVYSTMSWYFAEHGVVNHEDEFVSSEDPAIHTNTTEGFWSLLKRQWHGSHHQYSPRFADAYVAELCFKYNHHKGKQVFTDLIQSIMTG